MKKRTNAANGRARASRRRRVRPAKSAGMPKPHSANTMSNATKMARTTSGMVRKTGLRGKGKPVGGRAPRLMVDTVRVTFWPEPRVTVAGLKGQVIVEVAGDIVGQVRL